MQTTGCCHFSFLFNFRMVKDSSLFVFFQWITARLHNKIKVLNVHLGHLVSRQVEVSWVLYACIILLFCFMQQSYTRLSPSFCHAECKKTYIRRLEIRLLFNGCSNMYWVKDPRMPGPVLSCSGKFMWQGHDPHCLSLCSSVIKSATEWPNHYQRLTGITGNWDSRTLHL